MLKVNFELLFKAWGLNLSPAELEETKISAFRALEMAAKHNVLNSMVYSKQIIGKNRLSFVKSTTSLPDVQKLSNDVTKLRNLTMH